MGLLLFYDVEFNIDVLILKTPKVHLTYKANTQLQSGFYDYLIW